MYHHQEQKCQISLHFQQCFIFLKQLPLANFHRILMDISWTLESKCPPWNKCHNTAIFRFVNLVLLEWPKPRSGKPLPHLWRSGPRWTVDWGFDGICSSSARNSVDICSTIESASGFMAIPLVVKQHQLGPQLILQNMWKINVWKRIIDLFETSTSTYLPSWKGRRPSFPRLYVVSPCKKMCFFQLISRSWCTSS